LDRIFAERKQTGGMDLEAVEMGLRAALHQAGAAAPSQLLQVSQANCRRAHNSVPLWPPGTLPRTALAAYSHRHG
jgi:hypothetical protein